MTERVLRGTRLGTSSYEDEREISPAPRQQVTYECPVRHRFELAFSVDADVPGVWECTFCGVEATRLDTDQPETKQIKPPRTHWDMLLERRSREELEELLAERLELLRSGQIGPSHLHQQAKSSKPSKGH